MKIIAIAHPANCDLLGIARQRLATLDQQEGITVVQSYERKDPKRRCRAGRYA